MNKSVGCFLFLFLFFKLFNLKVRILHFGSLRLIGIDDIVNRHIIKPVA